MALNADWHRQHHMPKNATAEQRLKWHLAHAEHCDCRAFTPEMRAKLEGEIAAKKRGER
jgi:hypothetical protein